MPSDEPSRPAPNDVVAGKFVLEKRIGHGGMGEVWSARHLELGTRVALKIMRTLDVGATWAVRFVNEAKAAASLESAHIARVFDVGRLDDGRPYMVMELLDGEPLSALIAKRVPLPAALAADLGLQLCAGLAAAHARGIVHRDIKPSNLFLIREHNGNVLLKILDFGVAKAPPSTDLDGDEPTLTETGALVGTPGYLAPEQVHSSRHVDARADVWGVGMVLYWLLAGESPFPRGDAGEYLVGVLTQAPRPLPARLPESSHAMKDLVRCCLERDLPFRYQDIAQLAESLAPFASEQRRTLATLTRETLERAGAASRNDPVPHASTEETTKLEGSPTSPSPDPPRRATWWRAPLLATVTAAALTALYFFGGQSTGAAPTSISTDTPAPRSVDEAASSVAPADPPPVAAPEAVPSATAPAAELVASQPRSPAAPPVPRITKSAEPSPSAPEPSSEPPKPATRCPPFCPLDG